MKNVTLLILSLSPFLVFGQCFQEQSYTLAGESTYIIPGQAGTTHLVEIEIKGADGGAFMWGGNPPSEGGEGANMKASFMVTSGDELLIMVGEKGQNGPGSPAGGGGAGGTAVVINNTDVLIAAGGGGGGGQGAANTGQGGQANTNSPAQGGAGPGTSGGGGFNDDGEDGLAGTGGGAGLLTGWGQGGQGGVVAGAGGDGFGGGGGGSGTGGGGGGGYQGGDGATGSGGDLRGKGGDSYVNALYSGTVIFNTAGGDGQGNNSDGFVTITCIPLNGVEINLTSQTDATCFGELDGTITVSAAGGITPYTFTIDGGSANETGLFTGLAAGTYTVQVQDGAGSTDDIQVTIGQPNQLILTEILVIDNVCADGMSGSLEVEASGGTSSGSYLYAINGGPSQSSPIFNNLSAGTYTIAVLDDVNCFEVIILEVEAGAEIETNIQTSDVTCFGDINGSLFIVAFGGNGGFTYSLDNIDFQTSEIFTELGGGIYTVYIMDSEGCIKEEDFEIIEPDELEIDVDNISGVSCIGSNDGSVTLSGNGGTGQYEYAISGGEFDSNPIIEGLSAGENGFLIMDENGCLDSVTIIIQEPDPVELVLVSQSDVDCGEVNTGTANFELEGGTGVITYDLSGNTNNDGMFTGLASGAYTIVASSESGCADSLDFTIGQTSSILIDLEDMSAIQCFGETTSVTISAEGGTEPYTYSNGGDFTDSSTFDNISGGTYIFSAMDATGCVSDTTIDITEPTQLMGTVVEILDLTCLGATDGTIVFSIQGGEGPYTLEEMTIEEDSIVTITNLSAGPTLISVTDLNGCELSLELIVGEPDAIEITVDDIIPMDCSMSVLGSVNVSAQGGTGLLSLSFDNDTISGIIDGLSSGSYTVIAEDENACQSMFTFEVPKVGELDIVSIVYENVSCFGEADGAILDIATSGGFGSYEYSLEGFDDPAAIFDLLAADIYTLNAVDSLGCEGSSTFTVSEPDELVLSIINSTLDDGSGNGTITVSATGGTPEYIYNINNGENQESNEFTGLTNDSYVITVTDSNGCTTSVTSVLTSATDIEDDFVGIYPIPCQQFINFTESVQSISVRNLEGKLVVLKDRGDAINVDHLPSGIYILSFIHNGKVNTRRVMKF